MAVSESLSSSTYDDRVPLKAKLGFTAANTSNILLSGLALGSIDIFYLKFYNLDPRLMAISWILFMGWNAVNDPLIGIIQDKTKSKLGRRVPYLRYGAIPYTITFLLVWFPFIYHSQFVYSFFAQWFPGIDTTDMGLFWNHLMMLFIFDTLFSMIGLICNILPAEMAITAQERTNVVAFATIVGVPGSILPTILPIMLLSGDSPNKTTFLIVMVIIALIAGILLYGGSYFIKENRYTVTEETLGFKASVIETFKNKPFLIMEITIFSFVVLQESMFSGLVYLMDYILIINGWISIVSLIPVVIVSGWVLWKILSKISILGLRKTMLRASFIALFGFVLLLAIGCFWGPKVSVEMAGISLGLMFIGLLTFVMINQPLIGEAIDYDEIRTEKRRETTYSGVNALITKPAVSIAHFIILSIMAIYGYNADLPVSAQPKSVSLGVFLAFTVVPICFILIGILAMMKFPLYGEEWKEQKRRLQEIHIQKEREYLAYLEARMSNKRENNVSKTILINQRIRKNRVE
ncbi:MAG: MFS transporter [Candidatus Odinarchaeota archaeon]